MDELSSSSIERAVVGALRSAIRDHGPITPEQIGSAAKRIVGNLKNARCPACGLAPADWSPQDNVLAASAAKP
jgi:hypothetical protein